MSLKFIQSGVEEFTNVNSHTGQHELRTYFANHLCTQNTTTTPLGIGATFTGGWEDCKDYQEVNVSVFSDKDSAVNGLVFQWSADGVNIGDTDSFTIYANSGTNYTPNPAFRYVRIVYTNGGTAQTSFSLQTLLRKTATGGSFHRVDSTLKDDSDARLNITVPKLKTAANTYVSQSATNNGNAKVSIEELESGISTNSNSQLKTTLYSSSGTEIYGDLVEARSNTPTKTNALNVQIGAGDPVSNLPIIMDFEHHQVHEGETYRHVIYNNSLDTGTVKYGITVATYASTIRAPHLVLACDIYNGAAKIDLYEGATFTGGSGATMVNRNRNSANTAATTLTTGVTSTDGNLIDSFFVAAGKFTSEGGRSSSEWVLKSNTIYRVDLIGLVAGTDSILSFNWYEDKGV